MTRRRILLLLVVALVGVIVATVVLVVGRDTSDRPRELDMTAVPPCELISQSDLLGLNTNPLGMPNDVSSEFGEEGTGCRYSARDGATIDMKEVTNYGVDRWTDGGIGRRTAEDVARIEEFRVIRVMTRSEREIDPEEDCRIYVDVADDQSLKVSVSGGEREGSAPACDVAHRAAEAAMRTLIDQAGPAER